MKKRLLQTAVFVFILMNTIAAFHAYKFTHFSKDVAEKTKGPKELGFAKKLQTLFLGINNPRPMNKSVPNVPYATVYLQSSEKIECWHIKIPNSKGTVVLFHGFTSNKSGLIAKSDIFNQLGYNTFLVDFIGSGGSEGNQTTVGCREARDVKVCMDYLTEQKERNLIVCGSSMGAAAILKAAETYNIQPNAAILECPFGTMYQTTCARFHQMQVPTFPMAGLLVFWGGIENGFWGFAHNPEDYAKAVRFPTLVIYGEKDASVSRGEIDNIMQNLNGNKLLKTYSEAGHDNYLQHYKNEWTSDVSGFLTTIKTPQYF